MADDGSERGLAQPGKRLDDSYYSDPQGDEGNREAPYQQPLPPSTSGMTLPSIQTFPFSYGPHSASQYPPADLCAAGSFSRPPPSANGYLARELPPLQLDQRQPQVYNRIQGREEPYGGSLTTYGDPYGRYVATGAPASVHPAYTGNDLPGPEVNATAPPQGAGYKRSSVACRYCRGRKIRCGGYQNTKNGKCTNCDKLRIDCVFHPVSNTGTAFIPVSAVPGGVPPETLLYGAYGQPLPPAGTSQCSAPPVSSTGPPPVYPMATRSNQYPLSHDDRADHGPRRPHEEDHPMRLPPPHPNRQREDPLRRSPDYTQSGSTPPVGHHQYIQSHCSDQTAMPQQNDHGGPTPQQSQPPNPSSGNLMTPPYAGLSFPAMVAKIVHRDAVTQMPIDLDHRLLNLLPSTGKSFICLQTFISKLQLKEEQRKMAESFNSQDTFLYVENTALCEHGKDITTNKGKVKGLFTAIMGIARANKCECCIQLKERFFEDCWALVDMDGSRVESTPCANCFFHNCKSPIHGFYTNSSGLSEKDFKLEESTLGYGTEVLKGRGSSNTSWKT